MEQLLTYQEVEVCFNGLPVIQGVSFALHPGEILGIVGASGSGKSTLLKAAMGLLGEGGMVTGGEIWLEGKNLPALSQRDMRPLRGAELGMIVQDAAGSLCPIRTIGSQMYECLAAHRKVTRAQAKQQAIALLETLELHDGERIWNSYPFQLSGGMNQRVCMAMAMLLKPKVLLADEPTSALDVVAQKQVLREVVQLRNRFNTAVMIVSHDMGVIAQVADAVLVLQGGRVVEYGQVQQVLTHPQHPHTQQLLEAVPRIRRMV